MMTSKDADSSTKTVRQLPLDDSTPERRPFTPEELEQVRLRCVAECSSSPLYRARAEKDPEYWNKLYLGQIPSSRRAD
jgi:hypothetical protein